jgi:hypothetical protein
MSRSRPEASELPSTNAGVLPSVRENLSVSQENSIRMAAMCCFFVANEPGCRDVTGNGDRLDGFEVLEAGLVTPTEKLIDGSV